MIFNNVAYTGHTGKIVLNIFSVTYYVKNTNYELLSKICVCV